MDRDGTGRWGVRQIKIPKVSNGVSSKRLLVSSYTLVYPTTTNPSFWTPVS